MVLITQSSLTSERNEFNMWYNKEDYERNMLWSKTQELMKKKNLNQSQLAKKMNVTRSVITSFKNGKINKPSFELMCKLADALDVSLDEFREEAE